MHPNDIQAGPVKGKGCRNSRLARRKPLTKNKDAEIIVESCRTENRRETAEEEKRGAFPGEGRKRDSGRLFSKVVDGSCPGRVLTAP